MHIYIFSTFWLKEERGRVNKTFLSIFLQPADRAYKSQNIDSQNDSITADAQYRSLKIEEKEPTAFSSQSRQYMGWESLNLTAQWLFTLGSIARMLPIEVLIAERKGEKGRWICPNWMSDWDAITAWLITNWQIWSRDKGSSRSTLEIAI